MMLSYKRALSSMSLRVGLNDAFGYDVLLTKVQFLRKKSTAIWSCINLNVICIELLGQQATGAVIRYFYGYKQSLVLNPLT